MIEDSWSDMAGVIGIFIFITGIMIWFAVIGLSYAGFEGFPMDRISYNMSIGLGMMIVGTGLTYVPRIAVLTERKSK